MNAQKYLLPLMLSLPSLVFAETKYVYVEKRDPVDLKYVASLMAGAAGASFDTSANYTVGFQNYDFEADDKFEVRGLFGAFLGVEFNVKENWAIQTGISYYQTTDFEPSGILTQDAGMVSSPGVYEYNYQVSTSQILWENKLLACKDRIHPYVSFGLGVAINDAKDFETNANPFLVFTPEYENTNKTSFSWSVGLGVDYDVVDQLRVGIGYRFTDLGKVGFEDGILVETPISESLQSSHLYTQELMLQFSYWIKNFS